MRMDAVNPMLPLLFPFVFASLAACAGKLASEGVVEATGGPDAPSPPSERLPATPTQDTGATVTRPAPAPPSQAPQTVPVPLTCSAFDLGAALAARGDWAMAERVMGQGWVRFHVSADDASRGTFDYAEATVEDGANGGIFSCAPGTSGTFAIDGTNREVRFVFPAPCGAFVLAFDDDSCPVERPDIELHTHFFMTEESTGIRSTEGMASRFTVGRCDAEFTRCSY